MTSREKPVPIKIERFGLPADSPLRTFIAVINTVIEQNWRIHETLFDKYLVYDERRKRLRTVNYRAVLTHAVALFDCLTVGWKLMTMGYLDKNGEFHSAFGLRRHQVFSVVKPLEERMHWARLLFDEMHTLIVFESINVPRPQQQQLSDSKSTSTVYEARELLRNDFGERILSATTTTLPRGIVPHLVQDGKRDDDDKINSEAYTNFLTELALSGTDVPQSIRDLAASINIYVSALMNDAGELSERIRDKNRFSVLLRAGGDPDICRAVINAIVSTLGNRVPGFNAYRVEYNTMFSRFRGESEGNFQKVMDWLAVSAARNLKNRSGFTLLWFEDIHVLMSQRGSGGGDSEHLINIKNAMLQSLDTVNKSTDVGRYALIFTSAQSDADLDEAFKRRIGVNVDATRCFVSKHLREAVCRLYGQIYRLNVYSGCESNVCNEGAKTAGQLNKRYVDATVQVRLATGVERFYVIRPEDRSRLGLHVDQLLRTGYTYYNLLGDAVVYNGNQWIGVMQRNADPTRGLMLRSVCAKDPDALKYHERLNTVLLYAGNVKVL